LVVHSSIVFKTTKFNWFHLVKIYRRLRHSIVGFIPLFPQGSEDSHVPFIFGTGFVVHEAGIIATNAHVINAIADLPQPDGFKGVPAAVLFFILTDLGMVQVHCNIAGIITLHEFDSGPSWYGTKTPDLAFVHIKVCGLLPVILRPPGRMYEEGEEVATAGYPMGTEQLRAPGWLHQFSPTLQTGIISAVHPFPCSVPHGFTVNVMVQGGASGSPVFSTKTGEVIGVVYASLHDYEFQTNQTVQRIPTNYTYAIPSHAIVNSLRLVLNDEAFTAALDESKPFREFFQAAKMVNLQTGESCPSQKLPW
jgi:S1-C subfamily serine protease